MTRSFAFTKIRTGWIDAEVQTLPVLFRSSMRATCPTLVRDFVDALESLATATTASCQREQEPGELESAFEHLIFCRDALQSLQTLKNELGQLAYEKAWGHPFPAEAESNLKSAILTAGPT